MSKRPAIKKQKLILLVVTLFVMIAVCILVIQTMNAQQLNIPASSDQQPTLSVMVIDVGQADSILVTLSTGETMLIDAGESSDDDAVFEELDERGIGDIDVLVATHPHSDHIGGMRSVVEHYRIGRMLMPDMTSQSDVYQDLIAAAEAHDIPVDEAYAGYRFSLGDAICTVVSPNAEADKDMNNESVVIFLDYNDSEFLFTGDMEEWAEDALLNSHEYVNADVLKVAHHGSFTGTSEAFLHAVTPDYAVISCGQNNKYGHPHQETLDKLKASGAVLYRTDVSGDILFLSDGKTITVQTGD